MSIIEKIVHWFSPPEDTCIKGPTPEESAASRQEWRKAIHDNRDEVQKMLSTVRQSKKVFDTINEDAHKVTNVARETQRVAENALKALEKRRHENRN